MRKTLLTVAAVAALTLSSGMVAVAEHTHWLLTPGTCVLDIASGQTSQSEGGGYHRFHMNVHIGTPGAFAFAEPNNPVSVGRNGACPQ